MVRQYRNGTETRMDYEQYLYGRTARDASHRATQVSHHGRIGSLAFGGALALGIVAVIAVFGGTIGEDAANAPAAPRLVPAPAMTVTLAASDDAAPQSRR